MRNILPLSAAALAALVASCAPAENKYALNYTRNTSLPTLKRIPDAHVAVEEVRGDQGLKNRVESLCSQGYVMTGYSVFTGEYVPPLFAKRFAAQNGCERVVLVREKIGQGVGTRMEAASYTPPSMGFVNTTLYSPSGRSYSAVSTVFNPPQGTYEARDYVYDAYRHGAAFLTRKENLATQTKQ